ncbi:hypothetical protein VNO77_01940 [Canavalia gladiata]|uniref:Uncharacterized protein n=1 Tax=Canavalia gladiata TaxID=3824 RepID=A0AAN9MS53_CANGL
MDPFLIHSPHMLITIYHTHRKRPLYPIGLLTQPISRPAPGSQNKISSRSPYRQGAYSKKISLPPISRPRTPLKTKKTLLNFSLSQMLTRLPGQYTLSHKLSHAAPLVGDFSLICQTLTLAG